MSDSGGLVGRLQGEPWQNRASCRMSDAALFDLPETPERSDQPPVARRLETAQAVCNGCPVKDKCLSEAIKHHDSGIRGGQVLHNGKPFHRSSTVTHTLSTGRPQGFQQARLSSSAAVAQAEPVSMAAIAREEQARIYGALVPEHHGNAQPMPASVTVWERARLTRAAKNLRGDA